MYSPTEQAILDELESAREQDVPIVDLFNAGWPNFAKPITDRERHQRVGAVITRINAKLAQAESVWRARVGRARHSYVLTVAADPR